MTSGEGRTGTPVDEDARVQRLLWAFERVGWAGMAVVLLAVLLGFAGGGPVSARTRSAADGSLVLSYERFGRTRTPQTLRMEVLAPAGGVDQAEVAVSRGWIERFRVDQVTPEPAEVRAEGDELVYVFDALGGRATVTFGVTPQGVGSARGSARAAGGERVAFHQWFYP